MGIETYLTVVFWLGIVGVSLRVLIMLGSSYPRNMKITTAGDTVHLLVGVFFLVWVCYLRFGS